MLLWIKLSDALKRVYEGAFKLLYVIWGFT